MAAGLRTWLDSVAMVPSVVMGVAKEALLLPPPPPLLLGPPAPARLVDTVPVTVPSVVTPWGGRGRTEGSAGGGQWGRRPPWEDSVALEEPTDLGGLYGRTPQIWEDPMGGLYERTIEYWRTPQIWEDPMGGPCGAGGPHRFGSPPRGRTLWQWRTP